jgi:hypothetical protein
MSYKMFLDDVRTPRMLYLEPSEWTHVKSFKEAVECVEKNGIPIEIRFDHDLGDGDYKTGADFARWLGEKIFYDGKKFPDGFTYEVHSMNPVGAENIRDIMGYFIFACCDPNAR